jgi:hypothetical protein
MDPNRVGRLLGIGTRMAAGKLRDGTAGAVAAVERGRASGPVVTGSEAGTVSGSRTAVADSQVAAGSDRRPTGPQNRPAASSSAALTDGGRRFASGAGRFSAALWKPFAHASGILTLQITGLLFAFFALGFGAKCWQLYRTAGFRDHHLAIYLGFAALFAWFALTSFWRASRKQRRG